LTIEFVKQFKIRRLRRILRGHRSLKQSNTIGRVIALTRALTTTRLEEGGGRYSPFFFGAAIDHAELVIRQYLLSRLAGLNLTRALLYASGKPGSALVYSLPPDWRRIIRTQGFKIASFRTAVLWNVYVGMVLAYGYIKIVKIILSSIKAAFKQSTHELGRYVYFDSLAPGNLPQSCKGGQQSLDIISWYMQWRGKISDIDAICHGINDTGQRNVNGIPVVSVPVSIPPLSHLGAITRFILWSIGACLIATWDFLRGRWWHALLLNQAALAAQVRIQNPELLAKDYLFHNSGWIYRPLWTYDAEHLGSKITFYFYSTNCDSFKRANGYAPLYYGYHAMNWPHYLVWDEYQADFVQRAVGETANISIVGPIWFHTSAQAIPTLPPKTVAVFDVQPARDAWYNTLGIEFDYYTAINAIQFLSDIHKVLKSFDAVMSLKRKRKIGRLAHSKYRNFVEKFDDHGNFITIDPDTSANQLIECCVASISTPFTSTAIIANELGKPTCYYDPTGLIQQDDRAAHGIPVICGIDELRCWIAQIFKEK
jgi:polysaccharide biosynthesis PFTS motif protein